MGENSPDPAEKARQSGLAEAATMKQKQGEV